MRGGSERCLGRGGEARGGRMRYRRAAPCSPVERGRPAPSRDSHSSSAARAGLPRPIGGESVLTRCVATCQARVSS